MNRGVPPTARKARTGEFTPPGVTRDARSKSVCETGASYEYGTLVLTCENELTAAMLGHGGRGEGSGPSLNGPPVRDVVYDEAPDLRVCETGAS
ncbi:hypothetical protein GCM10010393_41180 [Streptomyces gobitricini]|uniref:Uncharacterized protein n=1 Tax=Streptomyces gobitricini TaxID=68211 RepID=A0ABP6A129_9ACTN